MWVAYVVGKALTLQWEAKQMGVRGLWENVE